MGTVWLVESVLKCSLGYCLNNLGVFLCRCGMKMPKGTIEIRKTLMLLDNTAGHHRPMLLAVVLRTYALKTLNS